MSGSSTVAVLATLRDYPYAVTCAVYVALYVLGLRLAPRQRRAMLAGSLLALPQALMPAALVPEYWHPRSVAVALVALEDVAYVFAAGGFAWLAAVAAVRNRLVVSFEPRRIALRWLAYYGFGALVFNASHLAGMRAMDALLASMVATIVGLLALRRTLWPLAASGALIGLAACLTILKLALVIWPQLIESWNAPNLWGVWFWGMPLEELVWTSLYPPAWGLGLAFMLDARVSAE